MPGDQLKSLRRLVKATRTLYLIEAAELARLNAAALDAAKRGETAEQHLSTSNASGIAAQRAIGWVARLRQELVEAQSGVATQVEIATGAMTKSKGAEHKLEVANELARKADMLRVLAEVIETLEVKKNSLG